MDGLKAGATGGNASTLSACAGRATPVRFAAVTHNLSFLASRRMAQLIEPQPPGSVHQFRITNSTNDTHRGTQ